MEAAAAEQRLGRLSALARLSDDVANDDTRALVGEAERDRTSDAGAAARDDGDLLPQAHCRILSPRDTVVVCAQRSSEPAGSPRSMLRSCAASTASSSPQCATSTSIARAASPATQRSTPTGAS